MHDRFTLADQDKASLPLTPVGNEIEDQFIWVFAKCPVPEGLTSLTLSHDALCDLWPEQMNLMNVERGETLRSALFNNGETEITVNLDN